MVHAGTTERPLVLASESPRRRALFGLLGLAFSARAARIDETLVPHETPVEAVQRFARKKATGVARQLHPLNSAIVVGADTIVVLEGEAFGKPRGVAEAVATLRRLRGREHRVYTALSLIAIPGNDAIEDLACTVVPMRTYSDDEICRYVCSGDPFDKAGSYAIQDPCFRPVDELTGCYANVMGLPLCHLAVQLRRLDVRLPVNTPLACQQKLGYTCPVYARVLADEAGPCTGEKASGSGAGVEDRA